MRRFPSGTVLLVFAGAIVIAAVVAGMLAIGSPAEERARQADRRRIRDLEEITDAVKTFWGRESKLPAAIAELQQGQLLTNEPHDPETGLAYEYRPLENSRFEVCAEFRAADEIDTTGFWSHGAGRQCFHPEAQPALR